MEINEHTPELVAVGIDDSQGSRAALAWAAEEARAHRRQLCVYHCWQPPVLVTAAMPGGFPPTSTWQDAYGAARAVLEQAMDWLRDHYPTVPATGAALEGPAGRRLAAHVRRDDLLVLGLGTRHRFTARVLGSTIDYALRRARGTVVVVPPDDRDDAEGPFGGHVIAALDHLETASAVAGAGFVEAAAHGWPLAVVHADPHRRGPDGALVLSGHPAGLQLLNGAVESWHARYPQVAVRRAAFDGSPATVLEHVTVGARLLVVGRSGHPSRPVRLTDLLLSRLGCPVAVTPLPAVADTVQEPARAAEPLVAT